MTLVLALTRQGSDLKINTRVLDKDAAKTALFDRTVTDTPQSDPVLTSASQQFFRLGSESSQEMT